MVRFFVFTDVDRDVKCWTFLYIYLDRGKGLEF
jgi:hypothetical protein